MDQSDQKKVALCSEKSEALLDKWIQDNVCHFEKPFQAENIERVFILHFLPDTKMG